MTSRSLAISKAQLADALTASRFILALVVIPVLARGAWSAAAFVVAAAWWSDFFDGRVARSTVGSRLGDWDPVADTAVGLGILLGLAGGGFLPGSAWWLLAAGGLTAAFLATRIFALSEIIQALGYGPLLWLAASRSSFGFALMVGTVLVILLADLRRFITFTLPAFFNGLRTVAELLVRTRSGR